jgi:hypothetical protein
MLVEGQVNCLHCGHSSGTWIGPKGAPLTGKGFRGSVPSRQDPGAPLRCLRCRGPVILEGAQPVATSARVRRIQRLRKRLASLGKDSGSAA